LEFFDSSPSFFVRLHILSLYHTGTICHTDVIRMGFSKDKQGVANANLHVDHKAGIAEYDATVNEMKESKVSIITSGAEGEKLRLPRLKDPRYVVVSIRRDKQGNLAASAYDSRTANEFQIDQSCCPKHWHSDTDGTKGLDVQAHVSYSQRDIAVAIFRMTKPSDHQFEEFVFKPLLAAKNDSNDTKLNDELDKIRNMGNINDIDKPVKKLDIIFEHWQSDQWDKVVDYLILMCTPKAKNADPHSGAGVLYEKSLEHNTDINLENFTDLNFIDPKKWTKFKQHFALGEQITPRIKLVAFTSPLIKGGSDEYIGEVEIPVSTITGLGGLIADRWTPMWDHSNRKVGEVRLKCSFDAGQKIRESVHIKPKKNVKNVRRVMKQIAITNVMSGFGSESRLKAAAKPTKNGLARKGILKLAGAPVSVSVDNSKIIELEKAAQQSKAREKKIQEQHHKEVTKLQEQINRSARSTRQTQQPFAPSASAASPMKGPTADELNVERNKTKKLEDDLLRKEKEAADLKAQYQAQMLKAEEAEVAKQAEAKKREEAEQRAAAATKRADAAMQVGAAGKDGEAVAAALEDMRKQSAEERSQLSQEKEALKLELDAMKKRHAAAERKAAMNAAVVASTPRGGAANTENVGRNMEGRGSTVVRR